ncbi:MAG: tellurite resistance/C4-dicarboxylate transporter family protein, partial [Limisphaerales bacterium]
NDLTHHSHSAAFLTMVAAACILGCQFVELYGWSSVAKYLWYSGIGLWVILNYTFFAVVTVRDPKPSLQVGINGVWLLTVVSTESICVLGALIAPFSKSAELILFPSLTFCLAGAAFYMFFITLILYRWMFFKMRPEKLSPDYWIDMGALAIITLSLSLLLSVSSRWELLGQLSPFLIGLMLLFWAMATWWIPFLCIVEIWRHTYGRVPFIYGPDYWSLVFPLGMYSVATTTLIKVLGLTGLHTLAVVFSVLAVATWVIVTLGLLRHLARNILIEKTLL